MNEEWRTIPEFPAYQASSEGRVRNLTTGHVLRQVHNRNTGYMQVSLRRDGRYHTPSVHRLVMLAFVGPRPEGLETRHGPAGRLVNSLQNLAYGTPKENQADRIRDGTSNHGERNGNHRSRRSKG